MTLAKPKAPRDPVRAAPADAAYEDDVHAWAFQQASLLRSGQWNRLDIEHLADEIEDVGRSEARELRGALAVVLLHLLKWDRQPERRRRSWALSIQEHRCRMADSLGENPSLEGKLSELLASAYRSGRNAALSETDLPGAGLPATCPYGWDEIMTRPIDWPEPA